MRGKKFSRNYIIKGYIYFEKLIRSDRLVGFLIFLLVMGNIVKLVRLWNKN